MKGKFHKGISLPYNLTLKEIAHAMDLTRADIEAHARIAYPLPLHEHFGKKQMSGVISNLMELNIARASKGLVRNHLSGGFPDLLPVGEYESDSVKIGRKGLEVKTSGLHNLSIAGHNAEDTWIIVFHYNFSPFSFRSVYVAKLNKSDWTSVERKPGSRITPTARINKKGMDKLRAGQVFST
jgi:hypothetical protein